jgi:2-methylisocitrate lyase-like PEP mutase family enzyme
VALTEQFRALHAEGTFVMANVFDAGSARLLASLGFPALATTSGGFAATLGRPDMSVTRDELVAHVAALTAAVDVPLSVDAERGYATTPEGVAETVGLLAEAGAAGCSIEDWDPAAGAIDDRDAAAARITAAAEAAHRTGMVLTGRCENHIHGVDDLADTIDRLVAYGEAGADVLFAPGLVAEHDVRRVVDGTGAPVSLLIFRGGVTVGQAGSWGVRRISVGSSLAWVAYGAVADAARALRDTGSVPVDAPWLSRPDAAAFRAV